MNDARLVVPNISRWSRLSSVLLAHFLAMGLRYALVVLIARILSVPEFGTYSTILAVMGIISIFTMGGWPTALLMHIPKHGVIKSLIRQARRSVVIQSSLWGIVQSFILYAVLRESWSLSLAALSVAILLLMSIGIVENEGVRASGRVVQSRFTDALIYPTGAMSALLVLYWSKGAPLGIVDVLIASVLGWLGLWLVSWRSLERVTVGGGQVITPDSKTRRDYLGIKVAQAVLSSSDVLLVGALVGLKQAALYAVARRITIIAGLGLNAVTMLYGPELSAAAVDSERLRRVTRRATFISVLLTIPISAGLLFGSTLILSTFGPEYSAAQPVLFVLLVGSAANSIAGPVGTLVNVNGQQGYSLKVMVVAALAYLVLSVPSFLIWGGLGGAVVWSLVTIGWNCALWVGVDYSRGESSVSISRVEV